jgi:fucose 4-O-acetylase-like acetyltransferase
MKRIIWIDYAKVIGIFLVIFGHLYISEGAHSTGLTPYYSDNLLTTVQT